MKKAVLTLIVLAGPALSALSQLNDLAYTNRMVFGKWVNLGPLKEWVAKDRDDNDQTNRPLSAWQVISGKKLSDGPKAASWIVEASVGGGKKQKLILMNAPAKELAEFTTLQKRWRELQEARDRHAGAHENARQGYNQALVAGQRTLAVAPDSPAYDGSINARLRARADMNAAEMTIEQIDRGLLDLEAEGIRRNCGNKFAEDFQIRCLALDTKQTLNGLPVHDRGFIMPGVR